MLRFFIFFIFVLLPFPAYADKSLIVNGIGKFILLPIIAVIVAIWGFRRLVKRADSGVPFSKKERQAIFLVILLMLGVFGHFLFKGYTGP